MDVSLLRLHGAAEKGGGPGPLLSIHAAFLSALPKMEQDLPPQHGSTVSGWSRGAHERE